MARDRISPNQNNIYLTPLGLIHDGCTPMDQHDGYTVKIIKIGMNTPVGYFLEKKN